MNTTTQARDRCPRCGVTFACGVAAPGPCACSTVALGAALSARLQAQFQGCLCLPCLQALAGAHGSGDSAAGSPTVA